MDSLSKYLALMQERPDLFHNTGEPGEIKIITDPERIRVEQKRIKKELRTQGNPEYWIDIGVLSEDEWLWTIRDLVEFPGGGIWGYIRTINRTSNDLGGFNVVLMCVQSDQVLMIRRFRHEERGWNWEFPRGYGEPNLSAEENAHKEMLEEIGVEPSRLVLLTEVHETKGGTAVFYAEISQKQKIILDAGEGIASYRWVAMAELDELVKQGKLSDWFTLWAYALAKIRNNENGIDRQRDK